MNADTSKKRNYTYSLTVTEQVVGAHIKWAFIRFALREILCRVYGWYESDNKNAERTRLEQFNIDLRKEINAMPQNCKNLITNDSRRQQLIYLCDIINNYPTTLFFCDQFDFNDPDYKLDLFKAIVLQFKETQSNGGLKFLLLRELWLIVYRVEKFPDPKKEQGVLNPITHIQTPGVSSSHSSDYLKQILTYHFSKSSQTPTTSGLMNSNPTTPLPSNISQTPVENRPSTSNQSTNIIFINSAKMLPIPNQPGAIIKSADEISVSTQSTMNSASFQTTRLPISIVSAMPSNHSLSGETIQNQILNQELKHTLNELHQNIIDNNDDIIFLD